MGGPEKGRVTTPSVRVFSKAPPAVQGFAGQALAVAGLLLFWALPVRAVAPRARTPSGEPVPRYVTLRAAPVNARGGPGEDYRALWQYTAKGLPLQVVEETDSWRRVCDPEGGLGWVRASAVEGHRAVMRLGARDLPIRARPNEQARAIAVLAARATADLLTCKAGWCRVSVDHATGWVRAGEVWGAADAPQCR
jgi:SH3-like domain-containing protein